MIKRKKRKIDVLVLSDIHLGTYGCRATELLNYLKTVEVKTLVLNGDIIDIWQFNKRYFPKSHMKIIKYFTMLLTKGTAVYYVTGNHDEMLRKFEGFHLGGLQVVNKLVLNLNGEKAWIFHGDVFDVTMKHSKWLAKLGGLGYDLLILINTLVNWFSQKFGYGKISLSKKIKNSVKSAIKHVNNFEETAANIAIFNQYDYVVCGHIHKPQMRKIKNKEGQEVMYLNSGDWIENLTALEYKKSSWSMYQYHLDPLVQDLENKDIIQEKDLQKMDFDTKQLFQEIIKEFHLVTSSENIL